MASSQENIAKAEQFGVFVVGSNYSSSSSSESSEKEDSFGGLSSGHSQAADRQHVLFHPKTMQRSQRHLKRVTTEPTGLVINAENRWRDYGDVVSSAEHSLDEFYAKSDRPAIGKGRYSTVFRVKRLSDNRISALKRIHERHMQSEKTKVRMLQEVRLLKRLNHINVIQCRNTFLQSGCLFIEFEWAGNGDLSRKIRRHRDRNQLFKEDRIYSYLFQISYALAHMHENNIIHRDLKPANIFLTLEDTVKIGDFGLSRYMNTESIMAHSHVGTPLYMSPEVLTDDGYSFKSDIWSLGCIMYELISLESPFMCTVNQQNGLIRLLERLKDCKIPPLKGGNVSEKLRRITMSLFEKDANERADARRIVRAAYREISKCKYKLPEIVRQSYLHENTPNSLVARYARSKSERNITALQKKHLDYEDEISRAPDVSLWQNSLDDSIGKEGESVLTALKYRKQNKEQMNAKELKPIIYKSKLKETRLKRRVSSKQLLSENFESLNHDLIVNENDDVEMSPVASSPVQVFHPSRRSRTSKKAAGKFIERPLSNRSSNSVNLESVVAKLQLVSSVDFDTIQSIQLVSSLLEILRSSSSSSSQAISLLCQRRLLRPLAKHIRIILNHSWADVVSVQSCVGLIRELVQKAQSQTIGPRIRNTLSDCRSDFELDTFVCDAVHHLLDVVRKKDVKHLFQSQTECCKSCLTFLASASRNPRIIQMVSTHLEKDASLTVKNSCMEFVCTILKAWEPNYIADHLNEIGGIIVRGFTGAEYNKALERLCIKCIIYVCLIHDHRFALQILASLPIEKQSLKAQIEILKDEMDIESQDLQEFWTSREMKTCESDRQDGYYVEQCGSNHEKSELIQRADGFDAHGVSIPGSLPSSDGYGYEDSAGSELSQKSFSPFSVNPCLESEAQSIYRRETPALNADFMPVQAPGLHRSQSSPQMKEPKGPKVNAHEEVRVYKLGFKRNSSFSTLDSPTMETVNEDEPFCASNDSEKRVFEREYRLGRSLGTGTFGEVLLALDKSGEFFAVKRMVVNSEKKRRNMEREIQFYTTLDHKHLVRYIGYNEINDGIVHILLEWQPGGSIQSLINEFGNPGLDLEIIELVTFQVSSALKYLHDNGIVHHDIKGANILYSDTDPQLGPVAKLTDFGCCLRDDDDDLTESLEQLRGTILWMAPEAAMQKGGRPADIWALGATLVEMYSGKPPFSHFKNQIEALAHIAQLKEPPAIPVIPSNGLARHCHDFLSHCFKLCPSERATIDQLVDHPFISRRTSTSRLPGRFKTRARSQRRRRTDMNIENVIGIQRSSSQLWSMDDKAVHRSSVLHSSPSLPEMNARDSFTRRMGNGTEEISTSISKFRPTSQNLHDYRTRRNTTLETPLYRRAQPNSFFQVKSTPQPEAENAFEYVNGKLNLGSSTICKLNRGKPHSELENHRTRVKALNSQSLPKLSYSLTREA